MNAETLAEVRRYPGRATRAIIDLDAIEQNLRAIKGTCQPSTQFMAVVKANAYGHGAVHVALAALAAGAEQLAVATVDEGCALRRAGIVAPILVLGPIDDSEIAIAAERRLTLAVGHVESVCAIQVHADRASLINPISVHIKVDTGMRRFGALPEQVVALATAVTTGSSLRLDGVFTHFACADEPEAEPTADQYAVFARVLNELRAAGIEPGLVHVANSAAALRGGYEAGMIRVGIALYGLNPSSHIAAPQGTRPAMTLVSRVQRVVELRAGDGVSYGATYRAAGKELAALVPIGYADGYRRALSNVAPISINGRRWKVRGRVCMDQTIAGAELKSPVAIGDEVILAGDSRDDSVPSFDELAALAHTINYEITSGIAARVPRFYLRSGHVVGIEDLSGYRAL